MTIGAGLAAFNTVASVVVGGPNWWTRAWAVALVVALLLMLVRIVRGERLELYHVFSGFLTDTSARTLRYPTDLET